MKCTKCGNELNDGVKFCPQCGEKIESQPKVKYCSKCGAEIPYDSSFCAKCGTKIVQKEKKKSGKGALVGVLAVVVVLLVAGCLYITSDKATYSAYVKFHDKYCEENSDYKQFGDCLARLVIGPKNKKMLAIYDITHVENDYIKDKITLYEYNWGKVKKVASYTSGSVNEFAMFSLINDELYLAVDEFDYNNDKYAFLQTDGNSNVSGVYRLAGNKFEGVKAKHTPDEPHLYVTDSGLNDFTFMLSLGYSNDFLHDLIRSNDIRSIEAEDFADVVKELSKSKIKDQSDLQVAYGNVIKKRGVSEVMSQICPYGYETDYPVVGIVENDEAFYYVRTSGNVSLFTLGDNGDFDKAVRAAGKRKVTGIDGMSDVLSGLFRLSEVPSKIKVPNNIRYIGAYAFQDCTFSEIELPKSLERIGSCAFTNCRSLEKIEIPDSVEKIGESAFYDCVSLQQIVMPDSVEHIGLDLVYCEHDENVIKPVIIAKKDSYAYRYGSDEGFDVSEKEKSNKELEERKRLNEAISAYSSYYNYYVTEFSNESPWGVSLIYLNNDEIPECILWRRYDQTSYYIGASVLYYNGNVQESERFSAMQSFDCLRYTPKSGLILSEYWINGEGQVFNIYKLDEENEFTTVAEVFDLWAGAYNPNMPAFTVNDEDYGSQQAVESYVDNFGLATTLSESNICYNVEDAYHALTR